MVIEVNQVVKKYKNNVAVNGVDLSVKEQEIFGLLGPNGAGKSTLMNTMLGLTKTSGGTVTIFGEDIFKEASKVKQFIGYVPQDFAFFEELNGYDNVTYWARLYGLKGEKLKSSVKEALDFVGLWDRRKDKANSYSGGMKRRLNIDCAIVHKPKLLFMDEPTVGVDPQSRNKILEAVKILNQQGTTVVYTSHYMEEIEAICSRVAIMDFGKIIAQGEINELIEENIIKETLSLTVNHNAKEVKTLIEAMDSSAQCKISGDVIEITFNKKTGSINEILETIVQNGITVTNLVMERPNLEMVFLKLTGKKLRD